MPITLTNSILRAPTGFAVVPSANPFTPYQTSDGLILKRNYNHPYVHRPEGAPVPITSNAPLVAQAVGYNTNTFNSTVYEATGAVSGQWGPFLWYGTTNNANAGVQNSDGSIFMSGAPPVNGFGGNLSTTFPSGNAAGFTGVAFGGGAYFEAMMSFTGQGNGPYNNGGPAFWAEDIEHMSQGPYANIIGWPSTATPWNNVTNYALNAIVSYNNMLWISSQPWPATGNLVNVSQPPPTGNRAFNNTYWRQYNNYFEVDFMEYDGSEFVYQNGIGNWWGNSGVSGMNGPSGSTSNTVFEGIAGGVAVPNTTNFAQYHKYGCLWVPATPTTQGYLKFYFDGAQTGETFFWNYYDITNPGAYPAAPPVNGSTAMSGMDFKHMSLILGCGTDQPTTVGSVNVWQVSAAYNLSY